ncbi:MAG: Maf family protein [Lachnospiraceae bacterium]
MKTRLILASASPRRKELLEQMGVEFEILPAVKEEIITSAIPSKVVLELSSQKAMEVACTYQTKLPFQEAETTVVIGSDTVVAFENQILGKPKDDADAKRMLSLLAGKTHSVFTGVTLLICQNGEQRMHSFYEETKVTMYPMSELELEAYVATKEPMGKAGAYAIQGKCGIYIQKIVGEYNTVVGFPIARIYQEMKNLNIEIL